MYRAPQIRTPLPAEHSTGGTQPMNRRDFLRAGLVLSTSGAALLADEPSGDEPRLGTPFSGERSKLKIERVRMVQPKPKRPLPAYEPAPGAWSTGGVEV